VVTDSGGLQKEAYWLRVRASLSAQTPSGSTPCASARKRSSIRRRQAALDAALAAARFPDDAPELYGDGHASERIATLLHS